MTYREWDITHNEKRNEILSRLTYLTPEEVEEYFLYSNMSINEPDFCGLYKDNKKCHDIEDLNCFLCGCPFFIYDDNGVSVEGNVTTYSTCSINAKEGSQFFSGNAVHQDCTNCTIPHHGKLPLTKIKKRIKMTHLEYTKKKESIATSDAPIEIREQAMKDLDAKYLKNPSEEARKQIIESASDTSDMGSAYE